MQKILIFSLAWLLFGCSSATSLDYDDEQLIEYNGRRFRVLRTYRTGQELELTVQRASAEEGGVYE